MNEYNKKVVKKYLSCGCILLLTSILLFGCSSSYSEPNSSSGTSNASPEMPSTVTDSSSQEQNNTTAASPLAPSEVPSTIAGRNPAELDAEKQKNTGFSDPSMILEDGSATYYFRQTVPNGEKYLELEENTQKSVAEESLLTFSLKVDTAAYSNIERLIKSGVKPTVEAVKIEEMINYFNYESPMSFNKNEPFSVYTEIGRSMLNEDKYMAFVRVKAKEIDKDNLPNSSLTFLIDTSGSMESHDKLPLLKQAFELLTQNLREGDTVSIVTYAGQAGLVLNGARGSDKKTIMDSINNLSASGSTAGGEGIMLAYWVAEQNFIPDGNNRIILATDGDFNVGISTTDELARLVKEKRGNGVYLSILGFGTGNIRDDIMETLSKNGSGNYSYINNLNTANKVLVEELGSNIFTIAEDVKAQIEFNPENVESYRLVGYENRMLKNEDFNNDAVDAGEIGIGTDVVMMFEFTLKNAGGQGLKYGDKQAVPSDSPSEYADELFEVRLRYKNPGEKESNLSLYPVKLTAMKDFNSNDFNFAQSVAAFGYILRDSKYAGDVNLNQIANTALDSLGNDKGNYRKDFVSLVNRYISLYD